jgi:hypothetical protein
MKKLEQFLANKHCFKYFKHSLELSDTHDFKIKTRADVLEALKTLNHSEKQITGFLEGFYGQENLRLNKKALFCVKICLVLVLIGVSIILQILML